MTKQKVIQYKQDIEELLEEIKRDCAGCVHWSGVDCTLVSPEKGCDRKEKVRMTPRSFGERRDEE